MLPVGLSPTKSPLPAVRPLEIAEAPAAPRASRLADSFQPGEARSRAPVAACVPELPEEPSGPVDGRAWAQDKLADIRARVANGEKVKVVFDLDNTIWDNRPRTTELARRFDAERGTNLFDGLTLDQVGKDGYETAINAGLTREQAKEFSKYWRQHAYSDEMNQFDAPLAEIDDLAKQAQEAGAEVIYLTARPEEERAGTLGNLERMGLPNADSAHLIMKPTEREPSAPYKVRELTRMQEAGDAHLAWFLTESRRDIGAVQDAKLEVPTVLIDAPWERKGRAVDPSTPIFPADVYGLPAKDEEDPILWWAA